MEKRIAQVISVAFYPLFVPTYAFAILLTMPAYFSILLPPAAKWMVIGLVFLTTCLLPTVLIFLMIKSGIVTTAYLSKREDRTMPYIVSIIFFNLIPCVLGIVNLVFYGDEETERFFASANRSH